MESGDLVRRGLPTVMSQTFRTLIHSRLEIGMKTYADRYPSSDVVLLEPERDDYRMFFSNIFRFSARRSVADHAYRATRRDLWRRREQLGPILERHGLRLRTEILEDESRDLWSSVSLHAATSSAEVVRDMDAALNRVEALLK